VPLSYRAISLVEGNMTLEEMFNRAGEFSATAWLYLPRGETWTLSSRSAVLESEEVPEDEEDEADAGVPEFAKLNGLKQVLPVTVVQDILSNLRSSRPMAGPSEMFTALMFYYDNDAFEAH
jgi:hypothetical protein